jgi:bla regulator protein BlaR1
MIGDIANHLWQSTAFALLIAGLAIAFRHNQARVRYALWLSASVKFVIPFAVLMSIGSGMDWAPAAQQLPPTAVKVAIVQISEPFEALASDTRVASTPVSIDWLGPVLFIVWASGLVAILWTRIQAWRRVRAVVRASRPLTIPSAGAPHDLEIRSAPGLLEPGIVGFLRPILLLPADITDHLTPAQLDAVLAHELSHVRRRDNLTAGVHMIVEALFWFHPLVWWIGARLVDERERACDEEVLRVVDEPQVYAEGILTVCRRYVETPLACTAGVSGADLRKRIEAIMFNRIGTTLSPARKVALALAAIASLATPLAVGMLNAPLSAAVIQQPPPAPAARPASADQEYEAASIRPCDDNGTVMTGGRGGATASGPAAPNRVSIQCVPLERIIGQAYVTARDLSLDTAQMGTLDHRIKGLPGWAREQYTIEAKAAGLPERRVLMGTMLRHLLEDRFKLKTHRESELTPMYALTVAKGGLKIKPLKDGECTQYDPANPPAPDDPPTCGGLRMARGSNGGRLLDFGGTTMASVAEMLSRNTDRSVLDRTGLTDLYKLKLEFMEDLRGSTASAAGTSPEVADPGGVSIFTAIEQLGLRLEPIKAQRQFIVIDHIERLSRN